eukprot:CAMPEP_0117742706 /NCGR_PEP_ID=MMETSP0947-20121206/5698_1 /TAXON_ID=44440 /ORGANISM="Chattonella subsalsa, Strain CCMP2191" /LENGTH=71 /DNA_ID=CAMNT_0005559265 /DNA_START=208 /DNA_END=426 /DNA_ORIENTATION=+
MNGESEMPGFYLLKDRKFSELNSLGSNVEELGTSFCFLWKKILRIHLAAHPPNNVGCMSWAEVPVNSYQMW